jgi:hypothetical protein
MATSLGSRFPSEVLKADETNENAGYLEGFM